MNRTYTVKAGDTLEGIAREHGTKASQIQALNPLISYPDHLRPGWELTLPEPPPRPVLPPPMYADSLTCVTLEGQPPCSEELVDVVHITGEPHFHILTATESKALKQEINVVQALMDELHRNLAEALPISQCLKPENPNAHCACSGCVKEAWSVKAEGAGLLVREPPAPTQATALTTDKDLQGQLATLQEARDWYSRYSPRWLSSTNFENNWQPLQSKKVEELNQAIHQLRLQLAAQHDAKPKASVTTANSAAPDLKHGKGRSLESQRGQQTRTGLTVVEVILFSDPTRRYYIPVRYRQTNRWHVRVPTRVMAGKPFNKQLAKDLIKDIKGGIAQGRKAGPLGSLELKISSWSSAEDNLLNTLHREVAWTSHEADSAPYAISAEAHALRFAASASAGVNNWDPKAGNIDIGVKGSAAFSLAEGVVSLNRFFPDQGGYVAKMAYRNALGKEVLQPMGVFRLKGKLELSCFVGAKAGGEGGAKLQYKPSETPAGATALLGTPTMEVGRSGNIGVKCDAFAGVQAGGALSGAFEWIEPDKQGTGEVKFGQANASSSWVKLAEVRAEGNIAVGVGASGEFGLSIANNRLAFDCKGSVVFGPGAGGGFGTVVDLEQVGKLALLFCNALADMDYRHMLGVTKEAFNYLARGLYVVALSPPKKIMEGFEWSLDEMRSWWEDREVSKAEAQRLASYVISHKDDKTMIVRGESIPFRLLPPEVLGPMVYVLTEGFIESFHQEQEQALIILLSEVRRWRQFIEVLEHCSPKAEKVNAMESLERINALLDGYDQDSFNRFVESLAVNSTTGITTRMAWGSKKWWYKEDVLLAARDSGRFDGLA